MSFAALLFVVFLVLKLTHVIDWSWLWITAPLWVGVAFWLVIAFFVGVIKAATKPSKKSTLPRPREFRGRHTTFSDWNKW